MTWSAANAHLGALGVDAMRSLEPSLHRIAALCEALDHPERQVPAIHLAGTNGKTSTARVTTALLNAAGLSVGTFTSPHLASVRERIARDGSALEESEFGEVFSHLAPYLELVESDLDEHLSYFEVLTGMFFLWAAQAPVDAIVVETGLGGRWDATNVVPAACAVLTSVGLDHTDLLGSDRLGIAREKAGIVDSGAIFVCGERDPNVQAVAVEVAEQAGADAVSLVGRDFDILDSAIAVDGRAFSMKTSATSYEQLFLPLHGRHQVANAAVAIEAVTRFLPMRELDSTVVQAGLDHVAVPGRLESFRVGPTRVLLDVAHNPDGISALVNALAESFGAKRVIAVAGFLADKDYEGMLLEVSRIARHLVATEARTERAVAASDVAESARRAGLEVSVAVTVGAALREALERAGPEDLVCITGSHYVVGEARSYLLEQAAAIS